MNLFKTKMLPRRDAVSALTEAIGRHPLTVVAAPMGYGKTTVADAVALSLPGTVYTHAVPAGPYDIRYLWNDLFTSLEEQGLPTARALRRNGFPESPAQMRRALDSLTASATASAATPVTPTVTLILDDLHHVAETDAGAFLEALARAETPGFRVAVFSRTRPELHLEELRCKGMAAVFGTPLLAFAEREAEEFFRTNGVADAEAARKSWRYAEGWPAALWLCLQSWRMTGGLGSPHDVDAMLDATVFSRCCAGERELLMRLSVLDGFSVPEAEALSHDPFAAERLRRLRDRNTFLVYEAKTGRYHFHGIFRSFLAKQLAATPDEIPALRRRAAECDIERGSLVSACRLLFAAGDDAALERILDIFTLPAGQGALAYHAAEVSSFVEAMPRRLYLRQPFGYLAYIHFRMLELGDVGASALLDAAERFFNAAPSLAESVKRRLAGETGLLRALIRARDVEAMNDSLAAARPLLQGRSAIVDRNTAWNFGVPHAAATRLRESGGYTGLLESLGRHWPLLREMTGGAGMGAEPLCQAEYHLERCEFGRIEPLLEDALHLGESGEQLSTVISAAFCRARLLLAQGETDECVAVLERLRPRTDAGDRPDHAECLDLALGYLLGSLGRSESAPAWLQGGDFAPPPRAAGPALGFILAVHGRVLLGAGDFGGLYAVALRIGNGPAGRGNLFARIHGHALEAVAARRLQGLKAAIAPMREALRLARPDGIVLTLAEFGGHIVPMLRQIRRESDGDEYLDKLLLYAERMDRQSAGPRKYKKGLLTPREREIMQFVARGRSNPAIARRLGIAEVTVKKALKLAYAKLGAANRAEAARRFEQAYGDKDKAERVTV